MAEKLESFLKEAQKIDQACVFIDKSNGNNKVKVKVAADGRNQSFYTDINPTHLESVKLQIIDPMLKAGLKDKIVIGTPEHYETQKSNIYFEFDADEYNILSNYINQ
tara:strand:+ start:4358 stop:4678 length:321 start_codon:yes stop_codon:yes gene_type:complete